MKYAGALARKNPRDPEILAILAAAYVRNMEFVHAVAVAGKALKYETRKASIVEREQQVEDCGEGRPQSAVATREWLILAAEKGSPWALRRAVRILSDPADPLYDPVLAMQLCQKGIGAGLWELYVSMGNLYLDEFNNLDKAGECYRNAVELSRETDPIPYFMELALMECLEKPGEEIYEKAKRFMEGWDVYFVEIDEPFSEPINENFPERGYITKHKTERYSSDSMDEIKKLSRRGKRKSLEERRNPSIMGEALFLFRIAAIKGVEEAKGAVSAIEQSMVQSREILENRDGLDTLEWAEALTAEGLRLCENREIPAHPLLAEQMLLKAYCLAPSSTRACILGMYYLFDDASSRYYIGESKILSEYRYSVIVGQRPNGPFPHHFRQNPTEAHCWLGRTSDSGYVPASRLLAEYYACGQEEGRSGELALKYATRYAESMPGDLYARKLLACAHARNGEFRRAREIVDALIAEEETRNGECSRDSWAMRALFEQERCAYIDIFEDNSWPRELPMTLCERVKAL